jgi:uncharacterized protein YndB with AHSA1/START domain
MIRGDLQRKELLMQEPESAERVEREILVPASPKRVWEAITDPEQVSEWLADDAEFDLRPGGDLRVRTDGETREGFFEEVDEPGRLVFWWAEPGTELTRVEVELDEVADGTRIRVVEARPLVTVETVAVGTETDFGGAQSPQMSGVLQAVA